MTLEGKQVWPRIALGELLKIKHGFAFKGEFFSNELGDIVLTPGNFAPSGGLIFRPDKDRSYKGEFPREYRLKEGDMLVVMTDLTQEARILGAPAFVPANPHCLHNQRLGKIINLDEERLDRRFLYYFMNDYQYRETLKATATGATVKHTSPGRIEACEVELPPLPTQRRIASILGAYDDLIDKNRRRIALLEEMARRLFEEWFVHLRFPGHEEHVVTNTSDGALPHGWERVPLQEMLVLQRGFDLPSASRGQGNFPVIAATGIHGYHSAAKARGPGIVTGRSGTIGQVMLVHDDHWPLNTTLFVKEFRRASPAYALQLLRGLNLESRSGGAAVPTLNRNHLHGLPVVCPPGELLERYEQHAMKLLKFAHAISRQQLMLASSRDLLLPRAMSGDITLNALERELEVAA